ncbi:UNVERIFIED_CONTAM: hypothetical protein PYX00_005924 [Menopon gallinae]|uniref:Uncharacterized protein n=1 Tax=Menopon gallinae TaxID=328185 RepID=A0AAW2HTG3_9NEOP
MAFNEFLTPSESGKHHKKDHKGAATDGDFHYSNYEADGDGDSEHFEEGEHYDDDGGHYSEGYTDDESSEGYHSSEDDSEGYYDGEGETKQKSVIHHGGPTGGATSYSVRHY